MAVEAKRDARIEDFPRAEEIPQATVYVGPPVPEEAQAALCRKPAEAEAKD